MTPGCTGTDVPSQSSAQPKGEPPQLCAQPGISRASERALNSMGHRAGDKLRTRLGSKPAQPLADPPLSSSAPLAARCQQHDALGTSRAGPALPTAAAPVRTVPAGPSGPCSHLLQREAVVGVELPAHLRDEVANPRVVRNSRQRLLQELRAKAPSAAGTGPGPLPVSPEGRGQGSDTVGLRWRCPQPRNVPFSPQPHLLQELHPGHAAALQGAGRAVPGFNCFSVPYF